MSTSYGPMLPGAAANISRGGTTKDWSNTLYAMAIDSNRAYAEIGAYGVSYVSGYLRCSGFGFSIPSDETIAGILVEVHCYGNKVYVPYAFQEEIGDETVQLYYSSALQGSNLADISTYWPADVNAIAWRSYGGESSLWGCSLTPSIVNDSGFGVVIAAQGKDSTDPNPTAFVDAVRMTVYTAQASGLWQPEIVGSIGRHAGILGV